MLTEQGQRREIAFFRFEGAPAPVAVTATPLPPLSPGFVSNRPEYQSEPQRNVTALLIDLVNTAPPDQNGARAQLLRHLRALPEASPVGVFQFSEPAGLSMLAPFSREVGGVRAGLESIVAVTRQELVRPGWRGNPIVGGECGSASGQGPLPPVSAPLRGMAPSGTMQEGLSALTESESRMLRELNQTVRTTRLTKTLGGLAALTDHLAAIPGRKNLVWISSGMPIQLTGQLHVNYEPRIRSLAQRIANAGIAVYPVDAKGGCRAQDTSRDQGLYGLNDAPQHVFGTFEVLADVTGGRVIKHTNDFSQGLVAAANDVRGTYTIGFYVPDASDGGWHPIQIAAPRRGVALRYRQGYLAASRTEMVALSPEEWTRLGAAPLGSSAIRLNGRPTLGSGQVTVLLQIAAADLYFHDRNGKTMADLEVGVVERTDAGPTNVRQQPLEVTINNPAQENRAALITSATTWPLNAATTSVRVIVRDRSTARYGTLDIQLKRD